eukprot:3444127-Rhodomonas_salina.1
MLFCLARALLCGRRLANAPRVSPARHYAFTLPFHSAIGFEVGPAVGSALRRVMPRQIRSQGSANCPQTAPQTDVHRAPHTGVQAGVGSSESDVRYARSSSAASLRLISSCLPALPPTSATCARDAPA